MKHQIVLDQPSAQKLMVRTGPPWRLELVPEASTWIEANCVGKAAFEQTEVPTNQYETVRCFNWCGQSKGYRRRRQKRIQNLLRFSHKRDAALFKLFWL